MLQIDTSLFIGKGTHREVYIHPGNPDLCIKIVIDDHFKEARREQNYLRLLQKQGIDWQVFPRYHGNVDTSLGEGSIFDLVKDYDGSISRDLDYYLDLYAKTGERSFDLNSALDEFRRKLLEDVIIIMNLKARNLLYQKVTPEAGRLVLIEDIGSSDLLPIATYIPYLGRKKINRKVNRFRGLLGLQPKHDRAPSS